MSSNLLLPAATAHMNFQMLFLWMWRFGSIYFSSIKQPFYVFFHKHLFLCALNLDIFLKNEEEAEEIEEKKELLRSCMVKVKQPHSG